MIKMELNKILENIINVASEDGFKEILIEPNKKIYLLKYAENKLIKEELKKIKTKTDVNTILNYVENLVGIENSKNNNSITTFLTPDKNILCRSYIFKNQNEQVINIKLLDHEIEKFSVYIKNLTKSKDEQKEIYQKVLETKNGGLVMISSQTENIKKNFFYSIIEEINNVKTSKILSFENPIERIIENKKSLIFQTKLLDESIDYIRFLNPEYVFIDKNLNPEIIKNAINMANSGIKVFIATNNTDFKKNILLIREYLKNDNLGLETFERLFLYFITLFNDEGKTFIYDIKNSSDMEY